MKPTIIKPTVGRVVLFHPPSNSAESGFAAPAAGEPLPALVARVWSDSCVNLAVFDANGVSHSRTSVRLIQDGEAVPEGGYYCEWMPYQKGQAAKAEALETKIEAGKLAGDSGRPAHQQRVLDEKDALNDKLIKLDAFILTSPVFLDLPAEEQERLTRQYRHMEAYRNVLSERIAAF